MACVTAYRLEEADQDPQLSMLREAVERFAGAPLDEESWATLSSKGLAREMYRRVAGVERDSALAMHSRLASAATLDDTLLALLRSASNGARHVLGEEAVALPEVAAALRERRRRKAVLLRGLLNKKALDRAGCPFCYRELTTKEVATLRQRHVIVHKAFTCNELVFFSEQPERLAAAIEELGDA